MSDQVPSTWRGDLARQYYPAASPKTARARFNADLRRNAALQAELAALGFGRTTRLLSPAMIRAIVKHLGQP